MAVTWAIIPTSVKGLTTTVSWLKFDTKTGTFHPEGSTKVIPTMRPVSSANRVNPSNRPLDGSARPPVVGRNSAKPPLNMAVWMNGPP